MSLMTDSAAAAPNSRLNSLLIGRLSWIRLTVTGLALLANGCGGASPSSILRTGTPAEAAAKAAGQYDSNKDGKIDKQELAASPALLAGLPHIDANRDGSIDIAELQKRFEAHDNMTDLASFDVQVLSGQAPLAGAEVTFTAEPFMGEGKQPYVGTTAENGVCGLRGQEAEVPGVPLGFYRVRIVHVASGVDITRGCEVAADLPTRNGMAFDVKLASGPIANSGR
jgi:hypothetical protein